MKDIRFRAWDNDADWYLPNVQNHVGNSESAFGYMIKNDRYVIEQFTGLLDKNGKEIYEGDIVVTDYGTGPVEYSGVGFSVDCDSISEYWENSQSIEIIGNIHENPELLEGRE